MWSMPLFLVIIPIYLLFWTSETGKCTAASVDSCTECNTDMHRKRAIDKCICEDGYYDDTS